MLALDLFRFNARMKVLTFAIGICVAFIVGSFAFANGLNMTVTDITDKFVREGALAYEGKDLTSSLFDASALNVSKSFASVGMVRASANDTTYVFFAVEDPVDVLSQNLSPSEGEMWSGEYLPLTGAINISTSEGSANLTSEHTYSSTMFPRYWHLINWDDLEKLRGSLEKNVSFIIFLNADNELLSSLRSQGIEVQEMTGILGYFDAGARQVTNDLWLIIIPSSFIVALLVYSAIAMETRDRTREIAILKTMGANNLQVSKIFLFQAFMLSLLGAAAGIILGIIISYAISTSSSMVIENSLFYLRVTEYSMLIAIVCTVSAGLLGSIWPIYRAAHQKVREAMR